MWVVMFCQWKHCIQITSGLSSFQKGGRFEWFCSSSCLCRIPFSLGSCRLLAVVLAAVFASPVKPGFWVSVHCRSQSPRSFWPAAEIESSGLVQHREPAIHGLPVKSGRSDWLRTRNEFSAHTQKIEYGQSSRSLLQARRIVGSGDEMDFTKDLKVQNDKHYHVSVMLRHQESPGFYPQHLQYL